MPPVTNLHRLHEAIDTCPIIDNHAHPLLKPEHLDKYPLLSFASEAHGDALVDHPNSLPHLRATRNLAALLGCDNNWAAVEAQIRQIRKTSPEEWTRKCLSGIEILLLDDGLDGPEQVQSYSWHNTYTRSKCKRIVRIEAVAGDIISKHCNDLSQGSKQQQVHTHVDQIIEEFKQIVEKSVADPEVVGFKSIICYRSGLDIPQLKDLGMATPVADLTAILEDHVSGRAPFKKLRHRSINQLFVHFTAKLIAESRDSHKKPFQFHTGLGDNDITLTRSSPSHLQEFIREHPTVPIVLLHGGYPWTREMGYLATHYSNVYADIGEVFPIVSRHGQEAILKQILELCPWSKTLWSTDGHWFPETYVLATMQARSVFKSVIGGFVRCGDIGEAHAIKLVQDIFFNNSNQLYNLEIKGPQPLAGPLVEESRTASSELQNPSSTSSPAIVQKLKDLGVKWLRTYWHDYTSSARCRLIPIKEVHKKLKNGESFFVDITKASLGLLQMDMAAPTVTGTGMYRLTLDWSTLKAGPTATHASCFGFLTELDGSQATLCPRTLLQNTLDQAADEGLSFLMGFEIEFVVMKRITESSGKEEYQTLPNDGHAWSMSRAIADWGREGSFSTAMDDILDALDKAEISIEMFHPESAPGQFEIVLPPLAPLAACDTLLHTRQIIESVAARHGFRVTLHPKPFPESCGTASHMHLSVATETEADKDSAATYELFYGGILDHLRAIIAITYPNPASYERMVDSFWAGGRWITWGTQNKEAPLRKCEGSHWELKVMDGLANPYFAARVVIAAGLDGIHKETDVVMWRDCTGDPAKMTDQERADLGIDKMFPANLTEALHALEEDTELCELLGEEFVTRFVKVKTAEVMFLKGMSAEERRRWIMERY